MGSTPYQLSRKIMKYDAVKLELYKNLYASVADEMGVVLCRTAFSPNIKERRDFSCAVFDSSGNMIAQAAHIPVHLGSMPLSVLSAIKSVDIEDGDAIILNDPFRGGTHLPDITLVSPVFIEGKNKPVYFIANRAHHADVGGISPGSMSLSTEITQEGIRIPPVRIVKKGVLNQELFELILANVRTPIERRGDLEAQIAANEIGKRRLIEITQKYGLEECLQYAQALLDYAEQMMRASIKHIRDGTYEFHDFMDDDGIDNKPVKIAVKVIINDDSVIVDFTDSAPQVQGSINAVYAITLSAVFYVFKCIGGQDIPSNSGCMRSITLITKKGSIVNAIFPAAIAGGNVETSQRIVDVLLGALSEALPDRIPAASCGSMNNIAIGGYDSIRSRSFAYYETIAGGMGARPTADGINGVHTHMTNTMNTPIEAIEHTYPIQLNQYTIRHGSGGSGKWRGGDGIIREMTMLCNAEVTILSDRRKYAPYGMNGGLPGKKGRNILIQHGEVESELPSKARIYLNAGDRIRIETPGGGGYGAKGKEAKG